MKYKDLNLQTQREFPNNARTVGFGWLVRAGYLTRENKILPLGELAISQLQKSDFLTLLPTLKSKTETFFPLEAGSVEVIHCTACGYAERLELAQFKKTPFSTEAPLPLEKILTPDCPPSRRWQTS